MIGDQPDLFRGTITNLLKKPDLQSGCRKK
jgi:hypothetical protein